MSVSVTYGCEYIGSFFKLQTDQDFSGYDTKSSMTVALLIYLYCQKGCQVLGQENGLHGCAFMVDGFENKMLLCSLLLKSGPVIHPVA